MLDNNAIMLVYQSSGDNIFYKVKNDSCIILIDSFGNEPSAKNVRLYVQKMSKCF